MDGTLKLLQIKSKATLGVDESFRVLSQYMRNVREYFIILTDKVNTENGLLALALFATPPPFKNNKFCSSTK